MIDSNEQLIYEHLGDVALAYLLATDLDVIHERFDNTKPILLNSEREAVLAQLVAIEDHSPDCDWAACLAELNPSHTLSIGNLLRQMSGGDIVVPPGDLDSLESTLAQLSLDAYPGLIAREHSLECLRFFPLCISLFRHPLNNEFQDIVLKDPDLAKLFPDESEMSGWSGHSLRSTGAGGSHQLWLFAEQLITSGWVAARLESSLPNIKQVMENVLRQLHVIRAAIRCEKTTVPCRLGLTGVIFPEDQDALDFGWARLRKTDERDERITKRTTLEGGLGTTTPEGQTITINYAGDLVIEFDLPYRLSIMKNMDMTMVDWPEELRGYLRIEEIFQNVQLGLLLACPDVKPVVVLAWQSVVDPLSHGMSMGWSDVKRAPRLTPIQLTKQQVCEWVHWTELVSKNRIPTIGVAIRRMLTAAVERQSPEDVLVDAVIVWENLFGARTETTLRISSSLAWLLGKSKEDRLAKQSNYKKIYRLRSDIVHGVASVDHKQLQESSQEAVQISIDALRSIFSEHADLLKIKSSEERSLLIMHAG